MTDVRDQNGCMLLKDTGHERFWGIWAIDWYCRVGSPLVQQGRLAELSQVVVHHRQVANGGKRLVMILTKELKGEVSGHQTRI